VADAKKKRVIKKAETVREKAAKKTEAPSKPRRLHKATAKVKGPLSTVRRVSQKEYHPVKLPEGKLGSFMNANRKVTPKFFREAWAELRQVTWPNRRETAKLTLAVFVFAIIFGALIAGVDYGLDKLFRKLLLDK
jgi:preprotein translocase SecE subunit